MTPCTNQALFIPNQITLVRNQPLSSNSNDTYYPIIKNWKNEYTMETVNNFKTCTDHSLWDISKPDIKLELELTQSIKIENNEPYSGFTLMYGDSLMDVMPYYQPHNNRYIVIFDNRYNSYMVVPIRTLMVTIIKFKANITNNTFVGDYVYAFNADYNCPTIVDINSPVKDFITETTLNSIHQIPTEKS